MAEPRTLCATPSRILLVLLGVVSLLGCSSPAQSPAPLIEHATTVVPSVPGANDVASFLDALTVRANQAAWSGVVDTRDPTFASQAERLGQNLAQLDVRFATTGRTHPLTGPRRELLGPTATVRAVRVDWAVPGYAPATHIIWLTLTSEDGWLRLAGANDGPAGDGPVPMWLKEPVRVVTGDGVAVLAGEGIDPDPWLSGLAVARAEIGRRGLAPVPLLAQVPSRDFERILGVRPSSHRSVAAAAWTFGETVHLVINPLAGGATQGEARQVLLTHEAVHVATDSSRGGGPLWLSEGYADLIALAEHPAVAHAHERHLAEDQRRHGVATDLVSDTELDPGNPRIDAHYQRAWLTVRVLDRSDRTADRVHAAVRAGTPLDRALADEGWTKAALTSAVHAELARLAG